MNLLSAQYRKGGTKMLLEPLMLSSWLALAVYTMWYFFKAKTLQPLTLEDPALTWQFHKKQTGCTASRLNSLLTRKDEVVGFKHDCGYEFQQKRLISQPVPKPKLPLENSVKSSVKKGEETL